MSDKKKLRQELKGPDAFQTQVFSILDVLAQHQKLVYTVIAVLFLSIAGIWGFQAYQDQIVEARREALSEIDRVFNEEAQVANKQIEAIEKDINALREKLPEEQPGAKAKSTGEQQAVENQIKALEDKAAAIRPDHAKSATQYQEFAAKYPGTPEGWAASMRYSDHLLKQKKFQEAKAVLEKVFSESKNYVLYQVQAGFTLVGIAEDLGEFDAALSTLDQMLKTAPDALKPKILLTKARVQMDKNASGEAQATLDSVIKDHGNTPEADQARSLKALIN